MSGDEIRAGLRNDEFVPLFQPVVTLNTGEVAGLEVLARWQHGSLGMVPPGAFIATAEQEGLISELTFGLMGKAFTAARMLPESQWLAINISPYLLRDLALPKRIREAAEAAGFPLSRVLIEITESALVEHLEHAQTISRELKAQGCRLALDDFGTGYSSLLHLQSLPFDELKVDRSFVGSMTDRRESRKIVSAVVGLGQSLGLATIAEGVETEEQAEMLLLLGCEMGQGWLFGKPIAAERLSEALTTRTPIRLRPSSSFWRNISYNSPPGQRLSHLQALYDGAPVGLAFLSPDFRYISINQQLAEMNDVTVQKHLGRHVSEIIPELYPQLESHLRRALAGESVNAMEVKQPATDRQHDEAFLASYLPAFDEAGEVVGISVAVIDVTARKRTEAALRESEDHYRHMVELNPQIPWVLDDNGMATMISPRWQQITGMNEEASRGRGFIRALHQADQKRVAETIEHSLRTGDPIDVECRVRTCDGEWRWIRSRGAPRRDESGRIIRWYGSADDIDAHKRLEEKLRSRAGEENFPCSENV
ncbi:EAL domain-containing protein [Acidobacterium sp. S8]|uniref:sensor domain-containing phosphodiesterase n=1 Tax=Acidobacterium sp. S8 TaxID=1641854 RepID=UPI00131C9309|nr:EAL domain-containing protein [Acidobacterium sp. S8]